MNNYIYLKIESKNINRFLHKCNIKNIDIINIKYLSHKSIIILINENDLKNINKIKGINRIDIYSYKGMIKYKRLIKKYDVFIISFIIGIILLLFLSNIIFEIDIESDNNNLNDIIRKELQENNIDRFKFKKNYKDIENIKKIIKNKYSDYIEWIEIKNNGVKYIVNIVERNKDSNNVDDKIYTIVSKKEGVIRNIIVDNGISVLNKGDYVSKGDILIDSNIYLNEELKNRVSAKGKVYAEVWYRVKIEYPLYYKEKIYTSNSRSIPFIKIGNKYIELFKYNSFTRNKKVFYKNKFNTLELGIEKINEIKIIAKKYSNNDAIKKAKDEARKKINIKLKDDEYIINQKTLKFYSNGSKIILDEFFSVYEEIGERKIIEMGEVNDSKNFENGS